jgi:hypothetical protein
VDNVDNNFDIFKKRLGARGVTEADRMAKDKYDSFKYALVHSYNSETVEKNGASYKALVSDDKVSMDQDQKNLSIEFTSGCKVGDTLYWGRTDTHWVVITQHITERAYFRGDMRKALYKIKWRDDTGKVYEQWVSLLGPTETKIDEQEKKGISFDAPNNSLTLWLGAGEGTAALKRYKNIYVAGKVWRINVADDLTSPGLIKLHLSEDLIDKDKDNQEEQLARDHEHMITEVPQVGETAISGLEKVSPVMGMTQTYTVEPSNVAGVWSVDPQFATIGRQDGISATINFTGKVGITQITYSLDGVITATKSVKVSSLLG